MATIDRMQRGTLSQQFFKRLKANQEVIYGPYYVLQHSVSGKHHSQRVPANEVVPVQNAIQGRERFEKLAQEFVEITERLTREGDKEEGAKKNSTKSAKRSSRKPKHS
jgi:hypothetical protein